MNIKKTAPTSLALVLLLCQCAENPLAPETRGDNEIWIQSGQFVPQTLTVARGTRVTWTNKDSETHSVEHGTFMNPILDFASQNMGQDSRFEHTFSKTGIFDYYCSIHQTGSVKQGQVVVD